MSSKQKQYILTIYGFAIRKDNDDYIVFPIIYKTNRNYLSIIEQATLYDLMFTNRIIKKVFKFDEEVFNNPNAIEISENNLNFINELGIKKISHKGNDGTPISKRLLINDSPIIVRPHPHYPELISLEDFIKSFEYFLNYIYAYSKNDEYRHFYSYLKTEGYFLIYKYEKSMIELIDNILSHLYLKKIPSHSKTILYQPEGVIVKGKEKTFYNRRLDNLDYEIEEDYNLTHQLPLPAPVFNLDALSGKEFLSKISHEVNDICKNLSMHKYNDLFIIAYEMGLLNENETLLFKATTGNKIIPIELIKMKKPTKKDLCKRIKKSLMLQNKEINTIFEHELTGLANMYHQDPSFLTTDDLLMLDHLSKITI